jgi:hypothetical protein
MTWMPAVRRVLDVVFAARSRLHLVWLGRIDPVRGQWRTLSRLVHRAANTPFGIDHDFARIRNEEDFRRLVPVRGREEASWYAARPGSAWPLSARHEQLASHRRGLRSALAVACASTPRAGLFAGPVVWLGDSLTANSPEQRGLRFPRLLRAALAHEGDGPASLLIGDADRALDFLTRNPSPLSVITWSQDNPQAVEALRAALPRGAVVEALVRPEGLFAVKGPRQGGLRLLPEHGVYFELLPLENPGLRLCLAEARTGEPYELVATSPGTWACRTGLGVCFEKLKPPIFHLVPLPREAAPAPAPFPQPRPTPVPGGLSDLFPVAVRPLGSTR